MGLFDKRRPQEEQETPQADWQADRARVASFLYRARTFNGTGPEDPTLTVALKPGERALLVATGTFLVEPRRVPARWAGEKSSTFRVTQRAATMAGNADSELAPVDSGDLTFTDKRVVFSGTHKSVDWEYDELLGLCHFDYPPWTVVAVSGKDRASGFRYDEGQAEEIRFAIALGLARFNDAGDSLVADLQEQLDAIDRGHQAAPAYAPGAAQPAQTWQGPPASGQGPVATGTPGPAAGAQPGLAATAQPPTAQPSTAQPSAAQPSAAQPGAQPGSAWPPANPFPAAPAAAPPAGATGAGAVWANPVPKPASSYMPESGATVIDGAAPGAAGRPVGEVATGAPAHPPSPSPGEMVSHALSGDVTTEPKPAEEPGVPTGQFPAVSPTPTATYPKVQPQPATPLQPIQHQQPQQAHQAAQGAPSTPPGWYPDPWRVARVRWWDGYSWTSYTSH